MTAIACIGSRETSAVVLAWMEETGAAIVRAGFSVHSGNAPGADQAWARGANTVDPAKVVLCLPWEGFEAHAVHPQNTVLTLRSANKTHARFFDAVRDTHPAFGRLSSQALSLHARNAMIVDKVHLVLGALNPFKPGGGGTGGAFRIAQRAGVATMNVADAFVREMITDRLSHGEDPLGRVYQLRGGKRL